LRTISDAGLALGKKGLRPNSKRHWQKLKRAVRPSAQFLRYRVWHPLWFAALGITRPLRTLLGLRTETIRRSRDEV
jgi:hypothetical protein